jgi:hypothetical protein
MKRFPPAVRTLRYTAVITGTAPTSALEVKADPGFGVLTAGRSHRARFWGRIALASSKADDLRTVFGQKDVAGLISRQTMAAMSATSSAAASPLPISTSSRSFSGPHASRRCLDA